MADPILDEDDIMSLLRSPISAENVSRLQAGAVQALIDVYDRKVTRDEFVNLASPILALYGQVGKLWMLSNIRDVYDAGNLDNGKFVAANTTMEDLIRKQAETVIEIVKRLKLCSTSQDVVH